MGSRSLEVHRKDIKDSCTDTLENKEPKQQRSMTERMTVNDRSTSVSCWTLLMMCKYIDFRRDVSRWVVLDHEYEDRTTFTENCCKSWYKCYSTIQLINDDRSTRNMTEADVKHVVFEMISPLLTQLDLRMNAEEAIAMACMPNCRLDYVLKYSGIPVGAIEVKCEDTFNKEAFAQAVIQLVVLQQWAYKKGRPYKVDMTKVPIVHILTDGERFVLMKIEQGTIYVQKSNPKAGSQKELTVRCISQNFSAVYKQLQDAVSLAVFKLGQLLDSATHADDTQGLASVTRNHHNHRNTISLNPKQNVDTWRWFLSPMKESKKKRERKTKEPGVDGSIEGQPSLSRAFATKIGDMYYLNPKTRLSEGVTQSKKKKRKKKQHH